MEPCGYVKCFTKLPRVPPPVNERPVQLHELRWRKYLRTNRLSDRKSREQLGHSGRVPSGQLAQGPTHLLAAKTEESHNQCPKTVPLLINNQRFGERRQPQHRG